MCDPITLGIMAAGTLASTAGGAMSSSEQLNNNTNIAAARNKQLQEVNAKDMAHAADSNADLTKTLGATTGASDAQGLQTAQQKAVQTIEGNMAPTGAGPTLNGDAPTAAKSGLGAALASAGAFSKGKADANGNLLGYTTQSRSNAMGDQDLGSAINLNNNFVRGDNALLPSSMDYSQIEANKPSSGIGEILSGVGNLAGGYAGRRAGMRGYSVI